MTRLARAARAAVATAALALALAASPSTATAGHKVFLNASDQTSNPVSCGGNEAQYAADCGVRTKALLVDWGFTVQYSQDFYNSPSMANNWGAERFLSIHTNAGGGHGTETLYKTTAGKTLAGHINSKIVAKIGFADRGLKYRDNLHMLNATDMPAALTELVFHDCTTTHSTPIGSMSESCFQKNPEGRQLSSEGMALGFCAHFGVSCSSAPATPVYDATAGAHEYPATMTSGDEAVAWFEFVNRGNQTWSIDGTRLGTQDPQDRQSVFFVDGNWLSPNRATGADHSDYGAGATGRFTFAIRAPAVDTETSFTETFQLLQEGVTWFGPKVTMTITVQPSTPPVDPDPPDPPSSPDAGGAAPPPPPVEDPDPVSPWMTGGCSAPGGAARAAGTTGALLLLGLALLTSRRRPASRR